MCKGISWIHNDCGHEKKFEVIPGMHCEVYMEIAIEDRHTLGCGNLIVIHSNTIVAPALCVSCFRRVEDGVWDQCDREIVLFQDDLDTVNAALVGEPHPSARKDLEAQRQEFMDVIKDLQIERKMAIADFRSRQGVWADG